MKNYKTHDSSQRIFWLMSVTKKVWFSHFPAIFPVSDPSLPRVGGGPGLRGGQWSEARVWGPGIINLRSSDSEARARRNYGIFDQYLTKNKKSMSNI